MSEQVRHPIFARLYARLSPKAEAKGIAEHAGRRSPGSPAASPPGRSTRRSSAIWQRADDWKIYPRLSGGCHAARDTESAIRAAGFGIERCRRFNFKGGPVTAPHIIGLARKS